VKVLRNDAKRGFPAAKRGTRWGATKKLRFQKAKDEQKNFTDIKTKGVPRGGNGEK